MIYYKYIKRGESEKVITTIIIDNIYYTNADWRNVNAWCFLKCLKFRVKWPKYAPCNLKWGGGGADSLKGDDNGDLPHPDTQETTTYTFKTYEDYFIDYFNLPAETYTRDEATGVVTIDYTKITRKIANGETELSYNGNVFYVVTIEDLTGTGSQTDPYVVHSTNGFLYLTNNSMSKIILHSKYIELNSDIILNDELFDEDGKPSGGDGTIYSWIPLDNAAVNYFEINGYNYSFVGMYLNLPNANNVSMFGNKRIKKLSNVNMKHLYINGNNYTSAFCYVITELVNCKILSGSIHGKSQTSGFSFDINKYNNAINFANIYGLNEVGGIVSNISGDCIENCKNYGTISITGGNSGGIVGRVYQGTIKNCKNYGEVKGGSNQLGGIVGIFVSSENAGLRIEACQNYGKVRSSSASNIGGILGIGEGVFSVFNCESGKSGVWYFASIGKKNF